MNEGQLMNLITTAIKFEINKKLEAYREQATKDVISDIDKIVAGVAVDIARMIDIQTISDKIVITIIKK